MNRRLKIVGFLVGLALGAFVVRPALAQLVSFYSRDSWVVAKDDRIFIPGYPNAALAAGLKIGGYKGHPDRPFTITGGSFSVGTASGGGAGNTVVTVTDGTNTCTITLPCTTSNAVNAYRVSAVDGAGTGCRYGKGAGINGSITTAGCTTTQPTVQSLLVLGRWEQ